MIKKIYNKLLSKSGKDYKIDNNIPDKLIYNSLIKRFIMLLRGYFWLYRKVFLGKSCQISNNRNIIIGKNVTIENHVEIDGFAKNKIRIGNNVKIGAYSWISCTSHLSKFGEGITIGNNSAFGKFTEFGAAGGIKIGNDVIGGSYISFHSENHNYLDENKLIREQGVTSKGIEIGNNVWIGAKVTFLDGSKIGNNTVIAAGAVVNGEFPNNVVLGGVPAKILKEIYK